MTRIRAAGSADFAAVAGLWREVEALHARLLPGAFRGPMAGRADASSFEKLRRGPGSTVLLAELDGAVAGFAALRLTGTPDEGNFRPVLRVHVEAVGVAAPARRRGVGRALMLAAETWGRELGAEEMGLTVWAGNEEAERFYEALGFQPLARALHRRIR